MSPLEPPFSTVPPEGPAPELDRSPGQKRATTRFWIAVPAGVCLIGLLAIILLPAFARITVDRGRPNTQNNMKVMGLVFKMYANESAGNRWPNLAPHDRIWAPELSVLYPEFLQDPSVLVAREHPDADHIRASLRAVLEGPNPDYETAEGLMALSFAYLGHAVRDEAGFHALVEARKQGLMDGSGENKPVLGHSDMIFPLRAGIERFFITDVNGVSGPLEERLRAVIPVVIEIAGWRYKTSPESYPGAHVLYMDGHVERVPHGTFPVVPSVMNALCGMAP
jgi:prepilin-type processing-associated H-X9-DG protein